MRSKTAVDAPVGEEQNLFEEYDEPSPHLGAFFVCLLKCLVTSLAILLLFHKYNSITCHCLISVVAF